MLRRAALVSCSLACALGCTRGGAGEGSKPPAAAADGGVAGAQLAAPADGLDEFWREGKLPPGLEAGTPVDGGTITVRMNVEPGHLMLLIEPDWWLLRLMLHNVNECLVRPDPHGHPDYEPIPELAERWEVSPDRLTTTFHLRKGVKWHDGKPFTSADVKFTFDKVMDPAVRASAIRQAFLDLAEWSAPDPHTFVMRWKQPYVWALRKMGEVPIYPAHAFAGHEGAEVQRRAVQAGADRHRPVQVRKVGRERVDHAGPQRGVLGKKGHADRLVYRIVLEPNVALQLLLRGEVDVDLNLTSEQYAELGKEQKLVANYHRVKVWDSNFSWIGWNLDRPVLKDRAVRRALGLLFDREKLRRTILKEVPQNANCIFYHLGKGCDPAAKQEAFDPGEAAKLLAAAGWGDTDGDGVLDRGGTALKLSIIYPRGQPGERAGAPRLQGAAQARRGRAGAGQGRVVGLHRKAAQHEFDACTLAWVGTTENDPYQVWHSSQVDDGSNYVSYKNPEMDALILRMRSEFDVEKRMSMFREVNAGVLRDAPYLLLYHQPRRTLVSRRLRGVYDSPIESFQFRDMWIDPSFQRKE